TLRRLIGKRGELRRIGQFLFGDATHGAERGRLPVAARGGAGLVDQQSVAARFLSVRRPVLSSSSVSTSPAASTARPDIASTLKRTRRSMPAMPIADSSAPIVVGIKVTNSATRTTTEMAPPA